MDQPQRLRATILSFASGMDSIGRASETLSCCQSSFSTRVGRGATYLVQSLGLDPVDVLSEGQCVCLECVGGQTPRSEGGGGDVRGGAARLLNLSDKLKGASA
jgi:hypothetical protein